MQHQLADVPLNVTVLGPCAEPSVALKLGSGRLSPGVPLHREAHAVAGYPANGHHHVARARCAWHRHTDARLAPTGYRGRCAVERDCARPLR